jgi:hypothetical protein
MKKLPVILGALVVSVLSSQVFAANEYPTTGLIYNTKEDSSITYNCTKMQNGLLECDFVQTSVRKKSKPTDMNEKIEQAKKQFLNDTKKPDPDFDKQCKQMSSFLGLLEGKETPEHYAQNAEVSDKQKFIQGIKEMSDSKKEDALINIRAFNVFCNTRSEESYLKLTQIDIDKDMRTCTVSSNPFKQTFRWVSDYSSGTGAWVSDSKAEGQCGVVQLNRFEFEPSSKDFGFWKYYAKKAITNPKGNVLPGFSCSNMDENEYLYDWKSDRDNKLGCEYIEFSPL